MKLRLLTAALFLLGIICLWQHADAQLMATGVGEGGAGGGASGPFVPYGVNFNGSTELWQPSSLSGGLSSQVDSKKGTFAVWLREGQDNTTDGIYTGFPNAVCQITRIASGFSSVNFFRVLCQNSSASNILVCAAATNTLTVAGGWTNFVASWDLSVPTVQLYINGVSDGCATNLTTVNDTIAYATGNGGGALGSLASANFYTGDMAEFFFDQAHFTDLTVSANLQKFINAGSAVDYGPNCATPTGVQPIVCFHGPVAIWHNNSGFGSGFPFHSGSLSAASSNPP